MNVTEPNRAKPTTSPIMLATVNTLFRNSSSGSTGSTARLSTSTNAQARMMPPPSKPRISGDDQA